MCRRTCLTQDGAMEAVKGVSQWGCVSNGLGGCCVSFHWLRAYNGT